MKFIDIGANLTHESFSSDLTAILEDARKEGVIHVILTGTDLQTNLNAIKLTKKYSSFLSSTVGFHPHSANNVDDAAFESAIELLKQDNVVAIGETGLDYNRNFSSKKAQLKVFEQHLELATCVNLPLFLHQREAHSDFLNLLKKYRHKVTGGVVHCFTGNENALSEYLDLDMYIGITGWICDERRGTDLQSIVKHIPGDRLLIETDSPYLLPRTITPKPKSRRNEPRHLPEVAKTIAEHTLNKVDEIAHITSRNAVRLFNLPIENITPPIKCSAKKLSLQR